MVLLAVSRAACLRELVFTMRHPNLVLESHVLDFTEGNAFFVRSTSMNEPFDSEVDDLLNSKHFVPSIQLSFSNLKYSLLGLYLLVLQISINVVQLHNCRHRGPSHGVNSVHLFWLCFCPLIRLVQTVIQQW